MQPKTKQEPSSIFAIGLKFNAFSSVQPSTCWFVEFSQLSQLTGHISSINVPLKLKLQPRSETASEQPPKAFISSLLSKQLFSELVSNEIEVNPESPLHE